VLWPEICESLPCTVALGVDSVMPAAVARVSSSFQSRLQCLAVHALLTPCLPSLTSPPHTPPGEYLDPCEMDQFAADCDENCTTKVSCSNNGRCIGDGTCECHPGWSGEGLFGSSWTSWIELKMNEFQKSEIAHVRKCEP
jgi:hypothetical protein